MLAFLLLAIVGTASADVVRTVYCSNICQDYLQINENDMPVCDHTATLNQCGSVVTCDPLDADKYLNRPFMNETQHSCCYKVTVNERGDCEWPAAEESLALQPVASSSPEVVHVCDAAVVPWMIVAVLCLLLTLETMYIARQCFLHTEKCTAQVSAVYARPLVSVRPHANARPLLQTPEI